MGKSFKMGAMLAGLMLFGATAGQARPAAHRHGAAFAYPPVIGRLSPDHAALTQVPGLTLQPAQAVVMVTGRRFVRGTVVVWDGKPLPTTFVSASQLTCSVVWAAQMAGAHDVARPAPNVAERVSRVRVVNPGGRPSRAVNFPISVEVLGG